jgi:cell wall-associated NlpC family hydrolase
MKPMPYADLVGVPYAEGGRAIAEGLDCWGAVMELCRRQGITVPDVFAGKDQLEVKLGQTGTAGLDWVSSLFGAWRRVDPPPVGSVLVFRDIDGAAVHAGVLVEPNRFLHCARRVGVTLCRLDREPWPEKLLGAYVYEL